MKIKTLFASRFLRLAAVALLTMAFASGCQTANRTPPGENTIHVPPGGFWQYHVGSGDRIDIAADCTIIVPGGSTIHPPDGNTIHVPPGGEKCRVPAGSTIDIAADSRIVVPGGSTIHVPPGADASKDGPA